MSVCPSSHPFILALFSPFIIIIQSHLYLCILLGCNQNIKVINKMEDIVFQKKLQSQLFISYLTFSAIDCTDGTEDVRYHLTPTG